MPRKTKVTRRGKNEGSVYQRKDGRWVGQVTVGYREDNGKPIRRYTYQATREEAAHWVALQVATELDRAGSVRSGELLLRDFLHNWLTACKVHEVCSRTMALYYDAERLHIAPALGDLPLGEVTPLKIQTFLYQLQAEKRLSQRTISLNKSVLVQMYDYAMELGLVENNPARNAKLPRQSRKIDDGDSKVIPIAQREKLLKAAESDPILCPILTLLMLTGMRIGEALALQWKHVDFQNRTISIQQSLTRELEFDGEGRTKKTAAALGVTKTRCSRRVIQAPDLILQRLREWMRYLSKRKGGLEALVPEGSCSTAPGPWGCGRTAGSGPVSATSWSETALGTSISTCTGSGTPTPPCCWSRRSAPRWCRNCWGTGTSAPRWGCTAMWCRRCSQG